jgi:hypothetical protein
MIRASKAVTAFFILFLLEIGLYWPAPHPLWQIQQAADWEKVPCTIISSELRRYRSGKGRPNYIAISYQYSFRGQRYGSSRYSFFTTSSSDTVWKNAVIQQHPPGATTSCFVNPQAPDEAVLERGVTKALWWDLLPLPLMATGLYVLRAWIVKTKEERAVPTPSRLLASRSGYGFKKGRR